MTAYTPQRDDTQKDTGDQLCSSRAKKCITRNQNEIDGDVDDVLSLGNLHAKLEAFGWRVLEEKNGNDLEAVIAVLEHAKSKTGNGKPVAIILHTEMGQGVDFMMGSHSWHGKAPNDAQLESALSQLYVETEADY